MGEAGGADASDGHLYTNTLDYASYGARVAQTVLATRAALDVLDRVAVAANHYFGLGVDPTKVNFRQVWRSLEQPRLLLGRVAEEIAGGNYAMLALTSMADDLVGNGWLEGRQRFRNVATHRFVVTHSERVGPSSWRPAKEIYHLYEPDLDEELIAALQTARSSILYLHEAVRLSEIMRDVPGATLPMYLPRLL